MKSERQSVSHLIRRAGFGATPSELDELTEDHNKLKAIVIFLALVIQHARKTFMSEHLNQFKNKVLVWDLLIGVPVKNFDDKERLDILQ